MTFGKPGRPPEDRLLRQREIFEAVAPLILKYGARRFSMREAADAASMSVGGLYYYFLTKRDLVLHGLDLAARDRICADETARIIALSRQQPRSLLDGTVDALMRIFSFIRPSALAVLELGNEAIQGTFDGDWTGNLSTLVEGFRRLLPDATDEHLASLARSVRWIVRGAVIDRDIDPEQVRADLRQMLAAQVGSVEAFGGHPDSVVASGRFSACTLRNYRSILE